MDLEWPDERGNMRRGRIPQNVLLFVDLIGVEATATLMLTLGGSEIYMARRPNRGLLERAIGEDLARKLGERFGQEHFRIPTNPRFLARFLKSQGLSGAKI